MGQVARWKGAIEARSRVEAEAIFEDGLPQAARDIVSIARGDIEVSKTRADMCRYVVERVLGRIPSEDVHSDNVTDLMRLLKRDQTPEAN